VAEFLPIGNKKVGTKRQNCWDKSY